MRVTVGAGYQTASIDGKTIGVTTIVYSREVRRLTANEIDLRVTLPLVAAGPGTLVYLRPLKATPLWLMLMIFAFHSFLTLHGVALAEEDGGIVLAGGAADEN